MPGWKTEHRAVTDTFYRGNFDAAKRFTGENPLARPLIDALKKDGLHLILATNPLFPRDGVETRLRWIGLSTADFELVTSYENMHYCKPNPKYFAEILEMTGKSAESCTPLATYPNTPFSALYDAIRTQRAAANG